MNKQQFARQHSTLEFARARFAIFLLLLVSILFSGVSASQAIEETSLANETVSTLTVEGRLAVFDDAWQTIFDRYYDPSFNGIDWEQQRMIFRPQAAEAANGPELYAVLRKLLASLKDVHTRIYAPDEKFDWWHPKVVGVGLTVREIGGLPIVVHVDKDSGPAREGIKPGDVIESVNGIPALRVIGARLDQPVTRTPATPNEVRAFASLLEGAANTAVDLRWRRRNGATREARFERTWRSRQLSLQIGRVGKYVVVQIDAFTPSIALDFTRGMKKALPGARGVVLDLRGNGGGEADSMADVASTFLGEGIALGTFTDRWKISFSIETRSKSLLAAEKLTQTRLPLVVLVGERTSSAAEIFVEALKSSRRATIIGTETCGCVLAVRNQHILPDHGVLDVSELDYQTSQGIRLQDNGIVPDEVVFPSREDLYANRDRVMVRALQRLASTKVVL